MRLLCHCLGWFSWVAPLAHAVCPTTAPSMTPTLLPIGGQHHWEVEASTVTLVQDHCSSASMETNGAWLNVVTTHSGRQAEMVSNKGKNQNVCNFCRVAVMHKQVRSKVCLELEEKTNFTRVWCHYPWKFLFIVISSVLWGWKYETSFFAKIQKYLMHAVLAASNCIEHGITSPAVLKHLDIESLLSALCLSITSPRSEHQDATSTRFSSVREVMSCSAQKLTTRTVYCCDVCSLQHVHSSMLTSVCSLQYAHSSMLTPVCSLQYAHFSMFTHRTPLHNIFTFTLRHKLPVRGY